MFTEDHFRLDRSTEWSEVYRIWKKREEDVWRPHYQEERGFATWEEWRGSQLNHIGLTNPQDCRWNVYLLIAPEVIVPQLFVGAYRGWQQYGSEGAETLTFGDVAKSEKLLENTAVQRLVQDPPQSRRLWGLRFGNQVVVRDGTHHCAAIALTAHLKLPPALCRTTIALTSLGANEEEIFIRASQQRHALSYGAP